MLEIVKLSAAVGKSIDEKKAHKGRNSKTELTNMGLRGALQIEKREGGYLAGTTIILSMSPKARMTLKFCHTLHLDVQGDFVRKRKFKIWIAYTRTTSPFMLKRI